MTRYIILLFIFGTTSFFGGCEDAIDDQNNGSISGLVVDYITQAPLANAIITTNPPSQSVMSDDQGKFFFSELEIGDYMVTAKKYNFKSTAVNIKVNKDKETTIIIQLEEDDGTNSTVQLNNPLPAEYDNHIAIPTKFAWQPVGSSNLTSLSYQLQVYSTESANPIIEIEDLTDTFYVADNLNYSSNYFWQITAKKNEIQVGQGDLWSFRTIDKPYMPFLFVSSNQSNLYSSEGQSMAWYLLSKETILNRFPRTNPVTEEVIFSATFDSQQFIYISDLNGENLNRISPLSVDGNHSVGEGFTWSPNGKEILFCHYDKLYRINKDGSGLFNLATAPANRNFVFVDWSETAGKLVILTRGNNIYDSEIYLMNPDGTASTMVINNEEGRTEYPTISPDGKYILYTHDYSLINANDGRQLDSRIVLFNISNSTKTDLSVNNKVNGTNDLQPKFSPDGSKIIFVNTSNTGTGQKNIFVMNVDGKNRELYFQNAEMPEWH